jgi:hypothetical protein
MERLGRLLETTQVVQDNGPIEMRFGVRGIEAERFIELIEGSVNFAHHRQAETSLVVHIGEFRMSVENVAELLVGGLEVVAFPGQPHPEP